METFANTITMDFCESLDCRENKDCKNVMMKRLCDAKDQLEKLKISCKSLKNINSCKLDYGKKFQNNYLMLKISLRN